MSSEEMGRNNEIYSSKNQPYAVKMGGGIYTPTSVT